MSVGLGFLRKFVSEGRPFSFIADNGLDKEHFKSDEIVLYDFIYNHTVQHGASPLPETIYAHLDIDLSVYPDEPIGYWIDLLKNRKKSEIISSTLSEVGELLTSGDLDNAPDILKKTIFDLERESNKRSVRDMSEMLPEVADIHDYRQMKPGMSGIPFGFQYLDELSDGAQGGDTIALIGRPSMGKSFILLRMALSAYQAGYSPLVVSMEMPAIQCARRLGSLATGLSSTLMRLGRLDYWGKNILRDGASHIFNIENGPFHVIEGSMSLSVDDLYVRLQELRPSIVYVDGAYLLRTKSHNKATWEKVAETAELLKSLSMEFDVPILQTYQFNREAAKRGSGSLSKIAGSDVIGQLASIVLGIDQEEEEVSRLSLVDYKILEVLKGREGEQGKIRIGWDMERMRIYQDSVIEGVQ